MNQDNINSKLEIIKDALPEEKKNALDSINNYNSIQSTNRSCSGPCSCYTILFLFLLFLWTIASIALFALGLALLFIAFALEIFCCLFKICCCFCCFKSEEENKGNYVVSTTTINLGFVVEGKENLGCKQKEIERVPEKEADCLLSCAPSFLCFSIKLIPKGYKKICNLYGDWLKEIEN